MGTMIVDDVRTYKRRNVGTSRYAFQSFVCFEKQFFCFLPFRFLLPVELHRSEICFNGTYATLVAFSVLYGLAFIRSDAFLVIFSILNFRASEFLFPFLVGRFQITEKKKSTTNHNFSLR